MTVRYSIETNGTFVIEDYNNAKPFYSFFPGIAGRDGIPCWGFYQNRGQGIAGFGFGNKDGALQEFVPADKASWYAVCRGFRTLIKGYSNGQTFFYEPFRCGNELDSQVQTKMMVKPAEIAFEEINFQLGLKVNVSYFPLVREMVGGLYRKTELVNLGQTPLQLEVVDGLAVMLPAGLSNFHAKNMGATLRAWMKTDFIDGVPYYKLNYLPDDVPELLPVAAAHFCYGYRVEDGQVKQLQPIYDPTLVFGNGADYQPTAFRDRSFQYHQAQIKENQLPAALHYLPLTLEPGIPTEFFELFGAAPRGAAQISELKTRVNPGYYAERRQLNHALIAEIGDYALTVSGESRFDAYIRQCFLDNGIRGGIPITLSGSNSEAAKVFWLYSRKHGDLERDYNDFYLSPSYFSQGNGNFRDICQNRRNDLAFNPDLRDSALHYFWNLIQLDGYNPLVIQGTICFWEDAEGLTRLLPENLSPVACQKIQDRLKETTFTPGELWQLLVEDLKLTPDCAQPVFEGILSESKRLENAIPGDGYWIDHWVYTLDLLDSFLNIYPDEAVNACFLRDDYTFYDNWNVLIQLKERFALFDGEVRRRASIDKDPEKQQLISSRKQQPHTVRINQGKAGDAYRTNLFVKMLILALNKLGSFDPLVTGLEMDAGRPGWCDALNGLPGIFGSSVSEVFALKRLLEQIAVLSRALPQMQKLLVPVEVGQFFEALDKCLQTLPASQVECFEFWELTHQIRDAYLMKVRLGLDGQDQEISLTQLGNFLGKACSLVECAVDKAKQETGLYHTYFYYKVRRWELREAVQNISDRRVPPVLVRPLEFEQFSLPLFLEGQVNALRGVSRPEQAHSFYQAVRSSQLYDQKLQMYKICANLSEAPEELGRIRVFPRGWLENESIFLHMEYKYLLEMFRSGLIEEFYSDFTKLAVCFLKPEIYGRNPLENVSFIVSSAYPRDELQGSGFVARLSGSTAEMVQIWLGMSFGMHPFRLNHQNQLELAFEPLLTPEFFSNAAQEIEVSWPDGEPRSYYLPAASYAVKFLNRTLVVYTNPNRKATFGKAAAQIQEIEVRFWDGDQLKANQPVLAGEIAQAVRLGKVERIDIRLK